MRLSFAQTTIPRIFKGSASKYCFQLLMPKQKLHWLRWMLHELKPVRAWQILVVHRDHDEEIRKSLQVLESSRKAAEDERDRLFVSRKVHLIDLTKSPLFDADMEAVVEEE